MQAEIESLGRQARIVLTDVAHVDQVRAMVDEAQRAFGRVDILVNNAGWTGTTAALDVTEEDYDRTMAASLKSVFFACQAAARVMIPQGGGKIINIGSNFGVVGFQGRSVYAAAKAGRPPPLPRALARMGDDRASQSTWSRRASPRRTPEK